MHCAAARGNPWYAVPPSCCAPVGRRRFLQVLTRSLILVLFTGPELLYFRTNPFRDRK